MKYTEDIHGLFLDGNNIWVETSEKDEKKGNRFDVIDERGQFVDSFFIGQRRDILAIHGKTLYVREKNADENYQIVIYQRVDGH
jgi:hypothetical protein